MALGCEVFQTEHAGHKWKVIKKLTWPKNCDQEKQRRKPTYWVFCSYLQVWLSLIEVNETILFGINKKKKTHNKLEWKNTRNLCFQYFFTAEMILLKKNQKMPASVVIIVINTAIWLLKQTYFPITHVQCTCFLHNWTKGPVLYKHSLK